MSYKNYSAEFKEKSLSLALSSDNPIPQTAKVLGFKESTLYSWVNQTGARSKACGKSQEPSSIKEMKKLKQELAQVKEERDILKKATAYLAKRKPVKYVWIAKNTSHFSLVYMCQITGVCKSGFYCGQK